jgi:hypothetical protein
MIRFVKVDDVVDRIQPDRFQPILQPQRRRPDRHVLKHQRAVPRAKIEILDRHLIARVALRQQIQIHRIAQGFLPAR